MNFVDNAVIKTDAGRGGDGSASFRREKFVPFGGPDGGDGGKGGSVIFKSTNDINTLLDYQRLRIFKAKGGENGRGKKQHGKDAGDIVLNVPVGTIIYEIDYEKKKDLGLENFSEIVKELKSQELKKEKVYDFKKPDEVFEIAKGGKGGLGNVHFKSSTNQAPREFTKGIEGETKIIELELKLIADVGIIGMPNVGKSTLISQISSARPEIADYPFTTIIPNLGVVEFDGKRKVFCDVPGLIEGAYLGKGLGVQFLKHIQRTKVLLHILDATSENLEKDYKLIRNELIRYDKKLGLKKEIIAVNKIDLNLDWQKQNKRFILKHSPIAISSITKEGIDKLLKKVFEK